MDTTTTDHVDDSHVRMSYFQSDSTAERRMTPESTDPSTPMRQPSLHPDPLDSRTAPQQSASPATFNSKVIDGACYGANTFWQCQDPVTITVKDLVYAVPAKEILPGCNTTCGIGSKNSKDLINKKVLLDNVSMIARPGELLAIVGPSGGGKTTLLNVLAMRSPAWRVPSGTAKFNGQAETKDTVKSTVNYVMAHDKMLPYLTVYETLASAADLKLPHLTKEERLIRVEAVIEDMCLDKCRNTYVGGEWRKGISTGEIKRVAIGMELLDEPSVLILDEPTSGLDGNLSAKIVELLLKEARKGRTVITTVHQPSSQIFEMFDRFLLVSHGQVVYHGAADRALPYFAKLGHTANKDWNPSDFLLDLVSDHPASTAANADDSDSTEERDDTEAQKSPRHLNEAERFGLIDKWRESEEQKQLMKEIETVEATMENQPRSKTNKKVLKSSRRWGHEVVTLWKRQSRNSIRNPLTAIVTLLVQAMQGLILGGIFFHLSKVSSGPRPDALLGIDVWNNPWVIAYNKGVDMQGNRPLVRAFETGVDGNGSYVLADSTTEDEEWQNNVHWLMDTVVTKLYNQPALGIRDLKYPELKGMGVNDKPAANWTAWTPERMYSNLMAVYQVFDRQWPNEQHHPTIDWSFFNVCYEQYLIDQDVQNFYFNILTLGKTTIDPLVDSVDLRELPSVSQSAEATADERKPRAPSAASLSTPESAELRFQAAKRRQLLSIGGTSGMEESIEELVGADLMQIIRAADDWVSRLTSCDQPLCDTFKSVTDFVGDWTTTTIDTISAVLNLSGCLFFVVSVLGFASYDALLTFPQERALFNRESANGLYRPSSYYLAKNLADLPFQMIPCLVMATIFYFMVGFDVTAKQYFIYFAICVLTTFCAYGFGYMVSAGAPRMEVAILIAPLTLVIWLVLAGFFLRDGDVPAWINWFKYLSFYRWAFFALVTNQFPPGGYFGTLPNTVHLALSGVTETNLGLSVGLLVVLGFSYRILGFVFLATTNRRVGLEA